MDFFIASLPRSRSAWTANYLTYGNTFCLHDGLKDCPEGVHQLMSLVPEVKFVGDADPASCLMQDKLISEYPQAKWIIIERPFQDVKDAVNKLGVDSSQLHVVQTKLEELRGKVDAFVVPFDILDYSIIDVAKFIDPDYQPREARHKMLTGLNVQVDIKKIQPVPSPEKIAEMVEPIVLEKSSQEYLALLSEMCGPERHAYVWMEQLVRTALVWDHFIDKDAVNPDLVNYVMESLVTEWPLNPFLRKYAESLIPTVVAAISAWKFSYTEGVPKDFAYNVYSDVPAAVAFIIGGNKKVQQYMPRIRNLVKTLCADDMKRDGGKL